MSEQVPAQSDVGRALRPWFKKKRFIFPMGFVLLLVIIGIAGGGSKPDTRATPATPVLSSAPSLTPTVDSSAAAEASQKAQQAQADASASASAAAAKAAASASSAAASRAAAAASSAAASKAAADKASADAAAAEAAEGTVSQQNAYRSAVDYLKFKAFSRKGLLQQLHSAAGEGYPAADAEFAIARLEREGGVDWNEQAAKSAKEYLEIQSFSRAGLLQQLTSSAGEGFTPAQAAYGVKEAGL